MPVKGCILNGFGDISDSDPCWAVILESLWLFRSLPLHMGNSSESNRYGQNCGLVWKSWLQQ